MCNILWLSELWDVGVMGCRSNGSSKLWPVGIKTRTPCDLCFIVNIYYNLVYLKSNPDRDQLD